MTPRHTGPDGRRHCYYVSQAVMQNRPEAEGSVRKIPARDVDRVVAKAVRRVLDVNATPIRRGPEPSQSTNDDSSIRRAIRKVVVARRSIALTVATPTEADGDDNENQSVGPEESTTSLTVPFELVEKGGVTRIVVNGDASKLFERTDSSLVKAVARAHAWKKQLLSGEVGSVTEVATRVEVTRAYVTRILRLSCLAPDLVEAILDGRQSPGMTVERLRRPIPLDWAEQRKLFGLSPSR